MDYVSLHNHTTFSILDSLISPDDLFKKSKELGQTAVAVTDHGTIAGAWDCLNASKKYGVKLIIGCECYFVDDVNNTDSRLRHIVLLAKNQIGYENLLKINAKGFDNFIVAFKKTIPRIDWSILEQHNEGIICTTACGNGILSQLINNKSFDEASLQASRLKSIFGDNLAIELQAHNLKRNANLYSEQVEQRFTNQYLKRIADEQNIKCIVTTDAHYVNKENAKAHDVLLAIASGHPVNSGSRLQYRSDENLIDDFYIKSGEEVFKKLKRVFGAEFAKQCIENSKFFADMCEEPNWINPKFTNASGKELPSFPVKDQSDFAEFLVWKEQCGLDKDEDELYLRFRCEKGLKEKIPTEKHEDYRKRLEEEYDVMEFHKFSSYMLIVMDYIEWARNNDIVVGPGRGCLTGDTNVLTDNGFVSLDSINVGDLVFTHTGNKKTVLNKFIYPVNETGLEIETEYSFSKIKLTKDHKVYASVSNETKRYTSMKSAGLPSYNSIKRWESSKDLKWIPANELKVGDYIFMPFPKRSSICPWDGSEYLDLSKFAQDHSLLIFDDKIEQRIPKTNNLSIRKISRETGLSRGAIQNVKYGRKYHSTTGNKISEYINNAGYDIEEWVETDNDYVKILDRWLKKDNDLLYVIGRWVGDGWTEYHPQKGYKVGFAFHSEDDVGIKRIFSYFYSKGFEVKRYNSKNKKTTQLLITGRVLYEFFTSMCNDYKQSSKTKHLPGIFRTLSDENLRHLLLGLSDSDGHVEINKCYKRENIDTTSRRLALEIKEALLYLGIPSSINTRSEYLRGKYLCNESYKVRFKGLKLKKSKSNLIIESGYFCKIRSLSDIKLDKVYDISVQDDTSYLTDNYAVHNSVGGSLIGYLTNIHLVDPIEYGLIFARFHNKEKTSFPDIDTDFEPHGLEKVQNYVRKKYGEYNVAHVSNILTMTAKPYAKSISRTFMYGGDRKVAVQVGAAIADAIPSDVHSVTEALEKAPLFAEYAKEYPELAEFAQDLSNKAVAWSTHAAGIVISKRPLRGLVPIRKDKEGSVALEYEKERTEANGLVKMDFLGLETLSIIKQTQQLIKSLGKELKPFDWQGYDKKAYDLIESGNTFRVFQLGTSGGTIDLCKKVKPKSIKEIAIVNALARPSSRDMRADFIDTRNGKKPVSLLHDSLQRAFGPTLGFGLYEECLLYLAQDVAGWSLHEADRLRKLTKEKGKNPEKAKKWRQEFIDDSEKNGIDKHVATKIWDEVVDLFSGYGFNRSLYFSELVDTYTPEGSFIASKPIKDVKPGEFVRSRDEVTGEDIYIEVVDNHDHGELEVFEIELETGQKVKCTINHKFRTIETGEMLPLHEIVRQGLSIVVG